MAIKTKEYYNLCGGNNTMTSGLLMKPDEVQHSVNAVFDTIGLVEKAPGHSLFWNLGVGATPVRRIEQLGANYYALHGGSIYKKGVGAPIASGLKTTSPIEKMLNHLFYISDSGVMHSTNGTIVDDLHLRNCPTGVDYIKVANNRMYAVKGNRIFISSPVGRIVCQVANSQTKDGLKVTVDSTRYLKKDTVVDVYSSDGQIKKDTFTITANGSSKEFTASARAQIVDEVVNEARDGVRVNFTIDNEMILGNAVVKVAGVTKVLGTDYTELDTKTIGFYVAPANNATVTVTYYRRLVAGDLIYYANGKDTDTIMWATDESTGDWFETQGDDGNPVGLIGQGGSLVVIQPQSTWRFTETAYTQIAAVGTLSPETIKVVGKMGVFTNDQGIWLIDGNDVYKASTKVDKYFEGVDGATIPYWSAGFSGNKYRVWIGDTTYKGVTNCEIIFDTASQKFETLSTFGVYSYKGFVSNNKLALYAGNDAGEVFKLDDGYSADGEAINFILMTRDNYLDSPGLIKLFNRVVFYTKPGTIVNIEYAVDSGQWISLGEVNQPSQAFDLSDIRGTYITFLITESSKREFPGILGYEVSGSYDEEI